MITNVIRYLILVRVLIYVNMNRVNSPSSESILHGRKDKNEDGCGAGDTHTLLGQSVTQAAVIFLHLCILL